jgi:hypothetical protein
VPVQDFKKFFFTERAVVQAVQIWSAPARYSADLLDVFEEDPLVEATALVSGPAPGNSRRRVNRDALDDGVAVGVPYPERQR